MPGKFIVVEGLEGAGKSTAIQIIEEYLRDKVGELVITREPGGTAVGEALRDEIKKPRPNEILDKRTELLMLYAARTQLIEEVIKPALARGSFVIADRFELSSYAYQGGGRGLSFELIDTLSRFCVGDLKPDLVLFLDIKPEHGLYRAEQRGQKDRIESESNQFFQAVYEGYHQALKKLSNVKLIDASRPLPEVKSAILEQLERFLQDG